MKKISIVIPCFNEESAIQIYYEEMSRIMKQMKQAKFELLFVDDGSTDATLDVMKSLHERDRRCKYLSFSRNFGKEAAIYAGLSRAEGDYVAIMDVDLQDPPALLPEMFQILEKEPYDSVATRRTTRTGESRIRSFLSESFYKLINKISKTEIVNGARDYRLMKRNMVEAVLEMGEYSRFSKGIFSWVGFRTKWLEYENVERSAGETKWPMRKLFSYSLEGIMGFSLAPLSLAWIAGAFFFFLSVLLFSTTFIQALVGGVHISKWLLLFGTIFMVSGVQMFSIGIMGQYLSKTYLEAKHRPIYILRDSSDVNEGENYGRKGA